MTVNPAAPLRALIATAIIATVAAGADAQSGNTPPVVDAATYFWDRHPERGEWWRLWHVVRVHDPDSRQVFVRVLVLDKTNTNVIKELHLGTEADEEAFKPLDTKGWGTQTPGFVGRIEFYVSDSDGNELAPIRLEIGDPESDRAPQLRSARLSRRTDQLTFVGKRLGRILGVEINGTRVPEASLEVTSSKSRVTFGNAARSLGLVEGWNTVQLTLSNGRTNTYLVRY